MRDIRRFETGQLFGIKARDYSVRTGTKVATLGRYDRTRNGFAVNMISSEGVAGSNQALRFQNRADAQRWIYANCARFGYDAEDMQVMNTVGSNDFWKVPVAGFDVDGWVNIRKFNYHSDVQMQRFIQEMPEYFDENDSRDAIDARFTQDPETGELIPRNTASEYSYRGFRF